MITITSGATSINPASFGLYRSRRTGGTVIHDIPGREEAPDYTLRPAQNRRGAFLLGFVTEAAAEAAELLHATAANFTLTISENPTANMTYVVPEDGAVERYQHPENPDLWMLDVTFREVAP